MFRFTLAVFLFLAPGFGQDPAPGLQSPHDQTLPNGKSQKDAILKADHEKNLADAQLLIDLAEELKTSLEKNTRFVLSVAELKRLDEIEKVARRVRSRMKRY